MAASRGFGEEPLARGRTSRALLISKAALGFLAVGGCSVPAGPSAGPPPSAPADAFTAPAPPSGDEAEASAKQEPLVTATPDEHSEVGELVRGFPEDLLPVPEDAAILVTSAVPVGDADVQEVSLNLRTAMTAGDLLEMYRGALLAAGFTEVPPPTTEAGLAAESMFTRSGGDELVSIGILDVDGARTVTIGGRIHTSS